MATTRKTASLVSIHGGHSGAFCHHARDDLDSIIRAYIDRGFAWIGLTEHMPPVDDRFLFPDERAAGLTAERIRRRFDRYLNCARQLQRKYRQRIRILVGFETEAYDGSLALVQELRNRHEPDYIVGSIHHVDDVNFDYGPDAYGQAVRAAGSVDALYRRYFDQQYDLIAQLRPEVVGHFDLVRIYDPDYRERLQRPEIWDRIRRNLELVREHDLILDFNVRALGKGAAEPYVSEAILRLAIELGIDLVPGDDSHGVATAGQFIETGIELLAHAGASVNWRMPGPHA